MFNFKLLKDFLSVCTFAVLIVMSDQAQPATTDLAAAPISYLKSSNIRPNIMFILDDSSSMAWSFLGDDVVEKKYQNAVGYRSHLCNKIYYNPEILYEPPVKADGTTFSDQDFSAALYDGFESSSVRINLANSFMAWRSKSSDPKIPNNTTQVSYKSDCQESDNDCDTDTLPKNNSRTKISNRPEAAYYFVYKGKRKDNLGDGSDDDHCKDVQFDASVTGKQNWIKVVVSATSGLQRADERQNFANWYSYYRTRILTMKTAIGHAFSTLDENFRVGFSTIGYEETDSNDKRFLKFSIFNNSQKQKFYEKLYGTELKLGTPLRTALVKAGRIYAGKLLQNSDDPLEYSCQRNFSILSSDGYWSDDKSPVQIDGSSSIGNQDRELPRPMREGPIATINTLADIASYYFKTDLRTAALNNCGGDKNLCENNVPVIAGNESGNYQQMITYTLGLGVNGKLKYQHNYDTATTGDFSDIIKGTKYWPDPINNKGAERIDDLWHAAVNGGGKYFSAQNPDDLTASLSATLHSLRTKVGTGAAAATSSQELLAGDNTLFVSQYRSVYWDGDLVARSIDMTTNSVSNLPRWSASDNLDKRLLQSGNPRKIYIYAADSGNKLKEFIWSNLNASEKAIFGSPCASVKKFSQCTFLTKTEANQVGGENLVNYLRGASNFEDRIGNANRYYRRRDHVLGALINAKPLYISQPEFRYLDENYASYRDSIQHNRKKMVYAAANDGMLHAFNADNGQEEWAYIPPAVLPEIISQADYNWATKFRYLLDGSPVAGDICPVSTSRKCEGRDWKTILVGGLAGGGRQFYALDVTNPDTPRALWVFGSNENANLGFAYGKPVITKRTDGRWVVILTSGYNNISPGDGKGYVYVLDADTGVLLDTISTGTGSTSAPSGLAQVNAWVDSPLDNTAKRLYGGDLTGSLWRFDINNIVSPEGKEAMALASFVRGNVAQPITTRPELSEIRTGTTQIPVVTVATGKYLGLSDVNDTSIQSIYTFKDMLSASGLGNLSGAPSMVSMTLQSNTDTSKRTVSGGTIDWQTKNGWYMDLVVNNVATGERVAIDIEQQSGILRFVTILPSTQACNFGGRSWLYTLGYRDGLFLPRAENRTAGSEVSSTKLITGARTIKLKDKMASILTDESGQITIVQDPSSPSSAKALQRVSWRELDEQ